MKQGFLRAIFFGFVRVILWPYKSIIESIETDKFRHELAEYKRIEHIEDGLDISTLTDTYYQMRKKKAKD